MNAKHPLAAPPPGAPRAGLQLRSLATGGGELRLSLVSVPVPQPQPNEVVVRIEAAPLNPSDLGLLLGDADWSAATCAGSGVDTVLHAPLPPKSQALAGRLDVSMPVGNEGAGVVIGAGSAEAAQALLGRTVAVMGGATYAEYCCVPVEQTLRLPDGITAAEGASSFINPLTALGMVATLRREGHTALVHTAAASNLGQMLNRLCLKEGIGLVNIVRSDAQERLLHAAGATHVCRSDASTFLYDLTAALVGTGATLAFDATGGGPLAGQILSAMEAALNRNATVYSRYGSTTHKQVYLYGGLDPRPVQFQRNFGMAWGIGGWLVMPFLKTLSPAELAALKQRVAAELKTVFASGYAQEISLLEALQPDVVAAYAARATGRKYLINPSKNVRD